MCRIQIFPPLAPNPWTSTTPQTSDGRIIGIGKLLISWSVLGFSEHWSPGRQSKVLEYASVKIRANNFIFVCDILANCIIQYDTLGDETFYNSSCSHASSILTTTSRISAGGCTSSFIKVNVIRSQTFYIINSVSCS